MKLNIKGRGLGSNKWNGCAFAESLEPTILLKKICKYFKSDLKYFKKVNFCINLIFNFKISLQLDLKF